MTHIEVLYFASCPTRERTVERVRRVLSEAGLEGSVSLRLAPAQRAWTVQRRLRRRLDGDRDLAEAHPL